MFIYSYVDSKKRTAETALHGAFSEGNLLQKDFTVGFYFLTVFQNFLHHVFRILSILKLQFAQSTSIL